MKDRLKKWFAAGIEYAKSNKKRTVIISGSAAVVCLLLLVIALVSGKDEEVTYRETQVVRGKLTVGVTESGNVSIGTSEQTFDLDISEYTSGASFSFGMEMGGGMPSVFQAMGGTNGNNSGSSSSSSASRALEIEEVYVTAGQEIAEGTPLLKLTDESVNTIRQELSEDSANAQITYEQAATSQKQTDLQAQANLDINTAYGSYAEAEYTTTIDTLQSSVTNMEEQIAEANADLEEKKADVEEMRVLLAEHQTVLVNAEYARDNTSREDSLYWWIESVNTVRDEEDLIETLETDIETTEEEIETLTSEISSLNIQLALAQKELRIGEITAGTQKDLRLFSYENAQEIYDVAVAQGNFETTNAQEDYEEAKQKLEEFDSVIQEGVISSESAGVITEVGVSAGNTLEQDDKIITLNDYGEATITVSVDEEDMEAAAVGNRVNISFNAFADEVFTGEVTEIGDAEINSNTNTTTYSVTVTVTEDMMDLYEGMSAEVTFITEESEEVLYVSKRAILEDGDSSYVKVRNAKGKIEKRKVTTGFSDGIHVEIVEGLTEGETVLIESSL